MKEKFVKMVKNSKVLDFKSENELFFNGFVEEFCSDKGIIWDEDDGRFIIYSYDKSESAEFIVKEHPNTPELSIIILG